MTASCKKFIRTTNLESAAILKKMGFQLINESDGVFIFLNNATLMFGKLDDVTYTSKLTFAK